MRTSRTTALSRIERATCIAYSKVELRGNDCARVLISPGSGDSAQIFIILAQEHCWDNRRCPKIHSEWSVVSAAGPLERLF